MKVYDLKETDELIAEGKELLFAIKEQIVLRMSEKYDVKDDKVKADFIEKYIQLEEIQLALAIYRKSLTK